MSNLPVAVSGGARGVALDLPARRHGTPRRAGRRQLRSHLLSRVERLRGGSAPVWTECFRVLRPGGVLLAGFMNPLFYLFDHDAARGRRAAHCQIPAPLLRPRKSRARGPAAFRQSAHSEIEFRNESKKADPAPLNEVVGRRQ